MKTSPPHRPEAVLPACYYLAHIAKGCYISEGKRITQGEIGRTYGTSTTTIRKVYWDIIKKVRGVGDRDYDELSDELLKDSRRLTTTRRPQTLHTE